MQRRHSLSIFIVGTGLLPILLLLMAVNGTHTVARQLQEVNLSGSLRFRSLWLYGATHEVPAEDWRPMWAHMESIRRRLRATYPADVARTDGAWNNALGQLTHTGRLEWATANALRVVSDTLTLTIERRARRDATGAGVVMTLGLVGMAFLVMKSLGMARRTERAEAEQRHLSAILEATPDFVGMADAQGNILYHNAALNKMAGLAPGAVLRGLHIRERHPQWAARVMQNEAWPAMREQGFWTGESALLDAEGREVPVSQTILAHRNANGDIERVSTIARDISAFRRVEADLRRAEQTYRAIFDHAAEGILQGTPDGRVLSANPALARMLGYDSPVHLMEKLTDIGAQMYADPADRTRLLEQIRAHGQASAFEAPLKRLDGGTVWVSMNVHAVQDENNGLAYLEGTLEDITNHRATVEALRQAEEKFRAIFENAMEGIVQTTPQGRFMTANPAMARILGYDSPQQLIEEMTDIGSQLYADPAERDRYRALMAQDGQAVSFEACLRRRDGTTMWASMNARAVRDAAGEIAYFEGSVEDMTEQHEAAERLQDYSVVLEFQKAELEKANAELEMLATTDGLTGLKNHRAFQQRLTETCETAERYGTPLSLLMLDVDHFKHYNDTFGHPAGDAVLRQVADILCRTARATDIAARYGGEEFVVVLPNTDAEGAVVFGERVRAAMERAEWPHRAVTVSAGVCTLRPGMSSPSEMVSAADAALYLSKQGGRNCVTAAGAQLTLDAA